MRNQNQYVQAPQRLHLPYQRQQRLILYAPSAVTPRNLANAVVALAVVHGSRTVELPAIKMLIIHGLRASRLVKVSCGDAEYCVVHCGAFCVAQTDLSR